MSERMANWSKVKAAIKARGETGLAETSIGAQVSISVLEKMMCGAYPNVPRRGLRERLSKFLKVPEDELFPLVSASEGEAS